MDVLLALVLGATVLTVVLRLLAVLPAARPPVRDRTSSPTSLLAVLGSGGHTMEMTRLLQALRAEYSPRLYVISDTDKFSEKKVAELEHLRGSSVEGKDWRIARIPRSREVRQSWLTTIVYTAKAILSSVPIVLRTLPDVILCNGPGTCVPICLVAYIPRFLGIKTIRVVYVESICRVHTLSLTGKILYNLADLFVVQWPTLCEKYPRAVYVGRFM